MSESLPRTRFLTIVAQDPAVKNRRASDSKRRILTEKVEIPAEDFDPGPRGYRVHVIDYDSSTGAHYLPLDYSDQKNKADPFEKITDEEILNNPHFHAQNVYAIVMKTLARFEFALGRRISWGFRGHQINIAPHAFADANAFYSKDDKGLLFGYFAAPTSENNKNPATIFSCLSHDVVAHEATHAILDGLRERYTTPTTPEQAGFHEGFADVVALLSVFALPRVIETLLENIGKRQKRKNDVEKDDLEKRNLGLIRTDKLSPENLKQSALFGLGEQMGQEIFGVRGKALRRSTAIRPLKEEESYLGTAEFEEPHRCGELLVAAMMSAFLEVWLKRIERLKGGDRNKEYLDRSLVVEQGADAADSLLTMAIRAIDYTPPTDITFADYLSALLTADKETVPDDSRYGYRKILRECFKRYGVEPASGASGYWKSPEGEFRYDRTHFDSLLREPDEIFRFIWDNRNRFVSDEKPQIEKDAYTRVQSVRPCLRIGPDGFAVRETVAEYVQTINMLSSELQQHDITKPKDLPDDVELTLYGGGTLIFDEYGRLKYHISNRIFSKTKQKCKISYLWRYGYYSDPEFTKNAFAKMHVRRSAVFSNHFTEEAFD